MADAGQADTDVLHDDAQADPEHTPHHDLRGERGAQVAPGGDGQQQGSQPEPHHSQPARRQPLQRELGQGHARAPEHSGGGQGEHGSTTGAVHGSIIGLSGPTN